MFPKIGVPQNVWFILEKVEGDVPQRCRSEVSKGVDPVETTFHLDSLKNAHRILMFCKSFLSLFGAPGKVQQVGQPVQSLGKSTLVCKPSDKGRSASL